MPRLSGSIHLVGEGVWTPPKTFRKQWLELKYGLSAGLLLAARDEVHPSLLSKGWYSLRRVSKFVDKYKAEVESQKA